MLSAGEFRVGVAVDGVGVAGGAAGGLVARKRRSHALELKKEAKQNEAMQGRLHNAYIELIKLTDGRPSALTLEQMEVIFSSEDITDRLRKLPPEVQNTLQQKLITLREELAVGETKPYPYRTLHLMVRDRRWDWSLVSRISDTTPTDLVNKILDVPGLLEAVTGRSVVASVVAVSTPADLRVYKKSWMLHLRDTAEFGEQRFGDMRLLWKQDVARFDKSARRWERISYGSVGVALLFATDVGTRIYTGGRSLPQVVLGIGE